MSVRYFPTVNHFELTSVRHVCRRIVYCDADQRSYTNIETLRGKNQWPVVRFVVRRQWPLLMFPVGLLVFVKNLAP